MRVKLDNNFSLDLAKEFYDYNQDATAESQKSLNPSYWKGMSITGKFRALHDAIAAAKVDTTPEKITYATEIYDGLGFQLYDFYDKMEAMVSSGDLGKVRK